MPTRKKIVAEGETEKPAVLRRVSGGFFNVDDGNAGVQPRKPTPTKKCPRTSSGSAAVTFNV